MNKTDRSQTIRGAHVDEIIGTGTIKKRLTTLEDKVNSGDTSTTPNGALPQPGTPYLVTSRIANDGKVEAAIRMTTIASNLKRFWLTHRLRRADGTYGQPRIQRVAVTAAMISNNSAEVILEHNWNANRQVDLVHIEGKFTNTKEEDGGGYAEQPDPYVETASPTLTSALAFFSTGNAQTDQQQINEALNSKLKFGQTAWGDTNGSGTHDDHRLARWRYGAVGLFGWNIDASIPDQTVDNTTNYWSSAVHVNPGSSTSVPAGVLVMRSAVSNKDPCVKLHQDPFDPGEPCVVMFSIYKPLARGSFPTSSITVTIEDGGTNQVLCSSVISLFQSIGGTPIPTTSWFTVRTPSMTIRSDYVPVAGAGQICRLHIDQDAQNGIIMVDKIMVSHMPGAYSASPRDRMVDAAPTVPSRGGGNGRGPQGFGTTGGESNTGGQIIRISTE